MECHPIRPGGGCLRSRVGSALGSHSWFLLLCHWVPRVWTHRSQLRWLRGGLREPGARPADGECAESGLKTARGRLDAAGVFWKPVSTLSPGATPGPDRRLLFRPQGGVPATRPVPTWGSRGPDQVCGSVVGCMEAGQDHHRIRWPGADAGRPVGTRQGSRSCFRISNQKRASIFRVVE